MWRGKNVRGHGSWECGTRRVSIHVWCAARLLLVLLVGVLFHVLEVGLVGLGFAALAAGVLVHGLEDLERSLLHRPGLGPDLLGISVIRAQVLAEVCDLLFEIVSRGGIDLLLELLKVLLCVVHNRLGRV